MENEMPEERRKRVREERRAAIRAGKKRCPRCERILPKEAYYSSEEKGRHSLFWCCIECHRKRGKERYDSEAASKRHRKRTYGLTHDEYEALSLKQGGVCAVCKRPETATQQGRTLPLAVDHVHHNGEVRGLLCQRCNITIGVLEDDPDLLRAAAEYLEERRGLFDFFFPRR